MSHQSDSSLLDVLLIGKEIRVTLSYFNILNCSLRDVSLSVSKWMWMCKDVGVDIYMLSTIGCVGRIYVRVDMLSTIGCVDMWE